MLLALPEGLGKKNVLYRLAALACMIGCAHPEQAPPARPSTVAPQAVPLPPASVVTRNGCVAHGALPDPRCTPGAVMTFQLDVICHQSTNVRRRVSAAVHRQAFTEYGLTFPHRTGPSRSTTSSRLNSAATTRSRTCGPRLLSRGLASTRRIVSRITFTRRSALGRWASGKHSAYSPPTGCRSGR